MGWNVYVFPAVSDELVLPDPAAIQSHPRRHPCHEGHITSCSSGKTPDGHISAKVRNRICDGKKRPAWLILRLHRSQREYVPEFKSPNNVHLLSIYSKSIAVWNKL